MDVAIRETAEVDLPELFRIRTDPRVLPHQFPLTRHDTMAAWRRQLFERPADARPTFRCTTVLLDGRIAGHISHLHHQAAGEHRCYCGWNLAPEYWGQGVMRRALSEVFETFFEQQRIAVVTSDCFRQNQRCLRLLHKLNFQPAGITVWERLSIATSFRCLHWLRRFQLTAQHWRQASPSQRPARTGS